MEPATTTFVEPQSSPIENVTAILTNTVLEPTERMRDSRLRRLASPILAIIQFYKYVTSPGLNDTEPLSCLRMREGGQHRY